MTAVALGYIGNARLAFDESKHPRNEDGEFGEGTNGERKAVKDMSKGERKTHDMKKKLESLRSGNTEHVKNLADAHSRTKQLHSQLVEQLSKPDTSNDAIKATVNEMGRKIAETELHTKTIEKSLAQEDRDSAHP